MCLLTYYPEGILPVTHELENGASRNTDGSGFAIATPAGHLITERYMDGYQAIDRFETLRKRHPGGPALFHSRFGTGGLFTKENCHPYRAGGGIKRTLIAHNGVLFSPPKGDYRSDTRIFAENIFPRRYPELDRSKTRWKLEEYLGSYNKLAVITTNPRYKHQGYLFNEKAGIWADSGAWHSNGDYKTRAGTYGYYWNDDYYSDCDICGTQAAVDSVTWYCLYCKSCQDCGQKADDGCMCYVPKHVRDEVTLTGKAPASQDDDWRQMSWDEYCELRPGREDFDDVLCAECKRHVAKCECAYENNPGSQVVLLPAEADLGDLDEPATWKPSISAAPPWSEHRPAVSHGLGFPTGQNKPRKAAGLSEDLVSAVRAYSEQERQATTSWHAAAKNGDLPIVGHIPGPGWAPSCLRCAARWPHPVSDSREIHPVRQHEDRDGVIHTIPSHLAGDSDICSLCLSDIDRGDGKPGVLRDIMRALDQCEGS